MKSRPTGYVKRSEILDACKADFSTLFKDYNREVAVQIAYILRFKHGFGYKRIERVLDEFMEAQREMMNQYMMKDTDHEFLCAEALRKSGIKIYQMLGVTEDEIRKGNREEADADDRKKPRTMP